MSTLLTATPGQTVGPFFGYALPFERGNELVPPGSPGAIRFHGVVTDGDGQAGSRCAAGDLAGRRRRQRSAAGGALRRDGWTFTGWGRAATDDEGHYSFSTVSRARPNPVRRRSSW